jgi:hypothetical protein
VQPLDYETPQKNTIRASTFWIALVPAYLLGIGILNELDDVLHRLLTGHHNDGAVMAISFYASPPFAAAAWLIKNTWRRFNTIAFAAVFAILAPILAYLLWITSELLWA